MSAPIGFMGMLYWFLTGINYDARADIRWKRIREIECILIFDVHRRIHRKRQEQGVKVRHKHWRWVIFVFYFVVALIVCLHKHCIIEF